MADDKRIAISDNGEKTSLTRRNFAGMSLMSAAAVITAGGYEGMIQDEKRMADEIKKEKIRRAMLAGPSSVTAEASRRAGPSGKLDSPSSRHE